MVRQKNNERVRLFVAKSPLFIHENDSVKSALEKMEKLNSSFLTIVKKDLQILGIINKKDIFESLQRAPQNSSKKISDFVKHDNLLLVYPMSTTWEAVTAMKTLKKTAVPVANNPWEKKFIGVLWFNDVYQPA